MGQITSTKPALTAADIEAACANALSASPPSPIASIQRGSTSFTGSKTVTISSVTRSKAMVNLLTAGGNNKITMRLSSSTEVVFQCPTGSTVTGVSYEVIQYA